MSPGELSAAVARLLGETPRSLTLLAGGRNNQVARAELAAGPVLVKAYFRDPADPRDRLRTEHGLLLHLWQHGIRAVPEPLAADWERHIGVQRFVSGERPKAIDARGVEALADLLAAMWRARDGAGALPIASEATFSPAALVGNVEARLAHLRDQADRDALGASLRAFLADELAPRLAAIAASLRRAPGFDRELPAEARTLSPSDIGFHNALADGERWTFVDFEYGGWDDPAKAIADACLQPDAPVPPALRDGFIARVIAGVPSAGLAERLSALTPLWAIKWSLIMLNEFLPAARRRRAAAGHEEDRRAIQLARAKERLLG